MGFVAKAVEKVPTWAQAILMVIAVFATVYGIAHDGWSFLLKMIFAPDL